MRCKKCGARVGDSDNYCYKCGNRLPKPKNEIQDLSLLPEVFVVVDIETTGLSPEKNEIIEIGAIKVYRDRELHDTFAGIIKPSRKIPHKITKITGISQALIDTEGESQDTVIAKFLDFIENHRLVFYNAPFDLPFLQKAASRINRDICNPVSDALEMARAAFPGRRSYKLASIAKAGGIDTKGAHRALKDCRMTMTVYSVAALQLNRIE